jgi:hypothetical protein
MEKQILASTVRLEWRFLMKTLANDENTVVDAGMGHGTVQGGRYVVTHNHMGVTFSEPETAPRVRVSVYTSQGEPIWRDAPLSTISVAGEYTETLVLDFGLYGEKGLWEALGFPSAEFRSWDSIHLQPGTEVAQVNWDGERAFVEWVLVDRVIMGEGLPRIELASRAESGASGAGVFLDGYHIANTWIRITSRRESGTILGHHTVAALNSPQVER